jgi:hypothetical protein
MLSVQHKLFATGHPKIKSPGRTGRLNQDKVYIKKLLINYRRSLPGSFHHLHHRFYVSDYY